MTREELLNQAKPILFNTEMVKAILEGRKTVTRRAIKYKYSNTEMKMRTDKYGTRLVEIQKDVEGETYGRNPDGSTWHKLLPFIEKRPPYKSGDILYVRETWTDWGCSECEDYECENCIASVAYLYKADGAVEGVKWKPSLHMPKEAARIFLKVTDVRAERLQDITEEQATKEGCQSGFHEYEGAIWGQEDTDEWTAVEKFQELWNSTIKKADLDKYGWEANPWVWVIEFERIEV